MPCRTIVDGHGGFAIVCSRGQRAASCEEPGCMAPGTQLCDYPLTGEKAGKTCDRRICRRHANHVGHDRDVCPAHAKG
jgi:hypothetical protein